MLLGLVLLLLAAPLSARRHAPELREEDPPRRNTRPAECQFGKQAKELGSTWFADLGPPFGVMYCIKCECLPVQKKRRVVAKVQCRNIKNDCPEPSCDTPVLLPGRCCKSCPGDVNSPDVLMEDSPMIVTAEEEELSMKHFGALLTGRSPLCIRRDDMSPVPTAQGVATGRFTFRRRHLYWSMLLGSLPETRPRALLFLDKGGRLLLEHPLKKHPGMHATYEDATDKICGVWRRVPRDYKRILREGSLYVALIWGDERNNSMDKALSGRINRYPALASEMFSALLEPELPPSVAGSLGGAGGCDEVRGGAGAGWWGATAVVTGAAGAAPSLHVALMYNGVFAPHQGRDSTVRLLLQAPDKNLTIIDEVQKVSKPGQEVNVLEVSTPVTAAELRSLSRGRLQLTLESPGSPSLRVRGSVRQRASCEVFQAPLLTERLPAEVPATGLAWMYIDKDGSLVYDIQMENMNTTIPKITLVDDFGKRHSQVEILDTMTGILARPSARIFSPLYEEQLGVHITSETGPLLLRGRLVSRPLPDAVSSGPVLLRRTDLGQPVNMVGLAWLAVDSLCSIHYEVSVSGGGDVSWEAWLETWALAAAAEAGGAGSRLRQLAGADGCVLEPSGAELAALHSGAAYIDLRASDNVTVLLRARLQQISVPPTCLPAVTWNSDNDLNPGNFIPTHVNPPPDNSITNPASCFYADRFYDDGSQWMSTESCNMCGCVHGSVRCDPVRCPPINCAVPTVKHPGECCPICTNTSAAEWNTSRGNVAGCYLAGQFHAAGASWHPYLVPGGYDTCAVCTCDYTSLVVRCPRVSCPPLRCPEKEAYRPDKKACCRVCPEPKDKKSEDGTLRDEGAPRTAAEILAEGGCVFPEGPLPNGKEVHPSIHSHGEQKCVTCRCKDGVVTCVRTRCGRGACSKRRRNDACCVCRRHRRHRQPRLDPPPPPPPLPS